MQESDGGVNSLADNKRSKSNEALAESSHLGEAVWRFLNIVDIVYEI